MILGYTFHYILSEARKYKGLDIQVNVYASNRLTRSGTVYEMMEAQLLTTWHEYLAKGRTGPRD